MKLKPCGIPAAPLAAIGFALALTAGALRAETTVSDAWVRGTVPQQKATGMFGRIVSSTGGKLVSAASPAAGSVEIHEMSMDGNVMRMRPVPSLVLAAGQTLDLKPGGYHVMLLDLKRPLVAGDAVAVTFVFEGTDGQRETVQVSAPVRALNTPGAPGPAASGMPMHDSKESHEHKH